MLLRNEEMKEPSIEELAYQKSCFLSWCLSYPEE